MWRRISPTRLGHPVDGIPGPLDAITGVAGVLVSQALLIRDLPDGHKLRTGMTAILPRGEASDEIPVFGGRFAPGGNGEMTGTTRLEASGQPARPAMRTACSRARPACRRECSMPYRHFSESGRRFINSRRTGHPATTIRRSTSTIDCWKTR